jgi:integrase
MRGLGRIFKRGDIWWVSYHHRGKEYRESARSQNEGMAKKLLKKRLGEIGRGKLIGPSEEKITFDMMANDLLTDYRVNGKRSVESAELSLKHLRGFFPLDRAVDITTDRVRAYVSRRQAEGASNGSINRELAALKRMFSLAVQASKLSSKPHIPLLEENNARQGFLDHGSFLALQAAIPVHLKDPITFLYLSGWRVSEMRQLEWRDLDLRGRVLRLRPEISKNKDGRILPLRGELLDVVERAAQRRRLDCTFVFHVAGQPIGQFRKSWKTACKSVGLSGLIPHDLRRTAIRNMVRAGIPERVAMSLSGHKTRAIFDRYNIVSESDLADAADRLYVHLQGQAGNRKIAGTKSGSKAAS